MREVLYASVVGGCMRQIVVEPAVVRPSRTGSECEPMEVAPKAHKDENE
jgi:hypothetical protein